MANTETTSKRKISNQSMLKDIFEEKNIKQDSKYPSKIPSVYGFPSNNGFGSNISHKK